MLNIEKYLQDYQRLIFSDNAIEKIQTLGSELSAGEDCKFGRVLIFGNGASASIASHFALDMTKQGKFISKCFHDPALLTAFSNDYGYENALSKIFESYRQDGDLVIVVSTSGESENIVRVQQTALNAGHYTVSFTGRDKNNRTKLESNISFWVDSHAYNIVENTHSIWLTTLVDFVIGKSVYEVS